MSKLKTRSGWYNRKDTLIKLKTTLIVNKVNSTTHDINNYYLLLSCQFQLDPPLIIATMLKFTELR